MTGIVPGMIACYSLHPDGFRRPYEPKHHSILYKRLCPLRIGGLPAIQDFGECRALHPFRKF